jgi:NAD(P)-dependent dehydrogenase (short-subunit alcohol dehydrogenase family)
VQGLTTALLSRGIHINVVCPGIIDIPMVASMLAPVKQNPGKG